jgi:hypothetical protein
MKVERYFYSTAALVMLAIAFAGFQPYYLAGEGMGGRQIAPELFTPVLVHAIALTGWMVLFLVPALLIDVRSRQVLKRIGSGGAAVALGVHQRLGPGSAVRPVGTGLSVLGHGLPAVPAGDEGRRSPG